MLKKCFKYDFKSVFKIWWIVSLTLMAISVAAGFAIKNLYLFGKDPNRYFIFENLTITGYIFCIIALFIITEVLVCVRYYTNFFSDEGYLTFTLPVKRTTLYSSKVLSAFLFQFMNLTVLIASVSIILYIVPVANGEYTNQLDHFLAALIELIINIYKDAGFIGIIYMLEIMLIGILSIISSILFLLMLITIGSIITKKYKIVTTVGLLVAVNYCSSAVVFPIFIALGLWINSVDYLFYETFKTMSDNDSVNVIALLLLLVIVAFITISTVAVCVTKGSLERKLNLA